MIKLVSGNAKPITSTNRLQKTLPNKPENHYSLPRRARTDRRETTITVFVDFTSASVLLGVKECLNGSITSLFNTFIQQNLKKNFQNTNKSEDDYPRQQIQLPPSFNVMTTYQHDR